MRGKARSMMITLVLMAYLKIIMSKQLGQERKGGRSKEQKWKQQHGLRDLNS